MQFFLHCDGTTRVRTYYVIRSAAVIFIPEQAIKCRKYEYFQILSKHSGIKRPPRFGFAREGLSAASKMLEYVTHVLALFSLHLSLPEQTELYVINRS